MDIDLKKISSVRSRDTGRMGYLLATVRRELEERIALSGKTFGRGLIVDFENTDLDPTTVRDRNWFSFLEDSLTGDSEMEADSYDCVIVNLQLAWLDYSNLLKVFHHVLKPGGELYFSTFGPDTLIELDRAWREVDGFAHVMAFTDMHHLGDALLASGFEKPIVDADWIYIDYPDPGLLLDDLRSEGFSNFRKDRRKTLTGKGRFARMQEALNSISGHGGGSRITYEIIYGYARKPLHGEGSVVVNFPTG